MAFRTLLIALLLLSYTGGRAQDDRAAVLGTIDRFFAAMTARDTAAMAHTLTKEGVFHAVPVGDTTMHLRAFSHQGYLEQLAHGSEVLVERYWEPEVMIKERIATVTTLYDFHVNGLLRHCGTDVFTLVLDTDGWRISGGVFTVQRNFCPASPLGPLPRQAPVNMDPEK